MNRPAGFLAGALAVFFALPTPGLGQAGEEAWLLDGRRLRGRLQTGLKGWSFLPEKTNTPWRLDQLDQVVFPSSSRTGELPSHQLVLPRGQWLSGELGEVTGQQLHFRTSWGQPLELARTIVVGVTQVPGWLTLVREDFETDLHRWQLLGRPTLSARQARSGKQSLLLEAGQQARFELSAPLAQGRLDLFFLAGAGPEDWTCQVDLGFVLLHLGPKGYFVADGIPALILPARPGWHHIQVDFSPGQGSLSVDDRLLWESHRAQKVELRQVVLRSQKGAAWFDDFRLCRPRQNQRRPAGLPDRDELWLAAGDQLFGRLLHANARQVTFQARSTSTRFGWEKLGGIFFRPEPLLPRRTQGEHVHLWLGSGRGLPPDEINGTLQGLDERRRLLLLHPLLGLLAIDRNHLVRLRWVFRGQRLELENNLVALGPAGQVLAGPQPTVVTGPSWKKAFALDAVPAAAGLVMQVVQVPGLREGVSSKTAGAALCTAVYLNGVLLGHLNDHVQRASSQPQEIRLPLPRAALRRGDNVLELRQIPEAKTGQISTGGVANLVLEIPE